MTTSNPSSTYLSEKISHLEAQAPVAPSEARAAQIPLQDFNLPTFPPEAFSAGLTSLILTSDVKMDDYQTLLEQPFSVPKLPHTITSLTLELFSLGYPRGFLVELCRALPGIRSLTVYSQLFAGTTNGSKEDAIAFLAGLKDMKEVHFLDVFTPPDVISDIASALSAETGFIEVSYTYRHSDPAFAESLLASELSGFVRKGGKALRLAMQAPDISAHDEDDREGTEVGIIPISSGAAINSAINALLENGKDLVLLDLTLFEVSIKDIIVILEACKDLKALALSVSLEKGWKDVFAELQGKLGGVESLELVGVPGKEAVEELKGNNKFLQKSTLEDIGGELKAVMISVLRTKGESWSKETGSWTE
jgi:hypothetical protein